MDYAPKAQSGSKKGVDYNLVEYASNRAASLMQTLCGATVCQTIVANPNAQPTLSQTKIPFNPDQINALLGAQYPRADMKTILTQLGFVFNADDTEVIVPSWRLLDVKEFPDLAEEVARIKGYNTVVPAFSQQHIIPQKKSTLDRMKNKINSYLLSQGFYQTNTFPMISPDDFNALGLSPDNSVQLANPLTPNESILRTHPLPSLIKVAAYNIKRQADHLKFFEWINIFKPSDKKAEEQWCLSGIITGQINPKVFTQALQSVNQTDLFYLKGLVQGLLAITDIDTLQFTPSKQPYFHPIQSLDIFVDKHRIGELGIVHPQFTQLYDIEKEVSFFTLEAHALSKLKPKSKKMASFSKFPSVRRDIALLAPKTLSYEEIAKIIHQSTPKSIKEFFLFDSFESEKIGTDKKSLAFAFIYQNKEKTLSDEEVNKSHQRLCRLLTEKLPVSIR